MKIAIINEKFTAGSDRCARDLQRYLSGKHDVRYYPRDENDTPDKTFEDLRSFKPDVVHLHSFFNFMPYDSLATISRLYATCYTAHDTRPVGQMEIPCWECWEKYCIPCPLLNTKTQRYNLFSNKYFKDRIKKIFTHSKVSKDLKIIAPSMWMRHRLFRSELKKIPMVHIPNGIDADHFKRIPGARMKLNLPDDSKIIFWGGHYNHPWKINFRKGLWYLTRAFADTIVKKVPKAILLIAGESVVPNHPNVRPLGFVERKDMPVCYSAADVFVLPTLGDNFPYGVLEAMACETPVVASRVGGIPEQVEEAVTGFLVEPYKPDLLAKAICDIFENPEMAQKMGKQGRQRVEKYFTISAFIEKHEALYEKLVLIRAAAQSL